jgi:hypothetical protein
MSVPSVGSPVRLAAVAFSSSPSELSYILRSLSSFPDVVSEDSSVSALGDSSLSVITPS